MHRRERRFPRVRPPPAKNSASNRMRWSCAAKLDAQYGSNPDLQKLPMYCTVITVKNWYDVTDMRSTGGNDVNYAQDFAPWDMTIVSQLRAKGAIISGITIASEPSFRGEEPAKPKTSFVGGNNVRSTWGGTTCNAYDTERSPGGSSGGAGASVAANMATCSICETTGGSCRIPANANAVASFVTTKGLTSEFGSATADFINHRPGVLCRTLGDAARVIDAMKDPKEGYFDSRDFLTAVPRALSAKEPFASSIVSDENVKPSDKPLQGSARRHRPRIHGQAHAERRSNQRSRRQGVQDDIARSPRRRAGRIGRSAVSGRSGRAEHEVHVRGRVRRSPADQCPGIFLPEDAATASSSSRCRATT